MPKPFSIVVAMDKSRGIGNKGALPWHLSADLKHFRELTTHVVNPKKQNALIMGRKTWESLPDKFKPLPNRVNIVLTQQLQYPVTDGVHTFSNLMEALHWVDKEINIEKIFVIGGGQIFEESLALSYCEKLHITHIQNEFSCDTFFPAFEDKFRAFKTSPVLKEGDIHYSFVEYHRLKGIS